jgi:hypothetical protein
MTDRVPLAISEKTIASLPTEELGVLAAEAIAHGDPVTVERLTRNALAELDRRFGDPELVKEISSAGLLSFVKEVLRGGNAETEELPAHPSLREIVEAANVPTARKLELLAAERLWLIQELAHVESAQVKHEAALERERLA